MRGLLVNFFLLALCLCLCTGHYRRISIDNTDICDETVFNVHKPVSIGTGAIILELSRPSIAFHPSQHKSKLCEIHIKAPEGFGITAYVEEAFFRQNVSDKSCKDYVQFGQDDSIVFVTLVKSDRICGHIDGRKDATKGFTYDDPHGNLLVWVNMWGRKKTTHWPAIYKMNLTLVLTAYQSNCGVKKTSTSLLKNVQPPGPGFASCGSDPGQCISKNYFCDKRFNCINHDGVPKSHDEADCQYAKDVEEENRKKSDDDDDDDDDDDEVLVDPGALNTISWVLIGICSMLGFLLVLILAVGCTKNSFCGRRHDQDCNSVDEPINLVELSANRPIAEQNIYLPLEPIPAGQISNQTTLPEEPPPAYHSLFPTDYVHPDQSSTNEIMNWTAAATATFPSLLGIAASRLGEHLRQSGLDLTKDLEKLPPNLKDLLRKLVIKSGAKCCNLYLPVLVHEKVATLDLSDLDIDSVSWLQKCPNLKKLNLKQCLRKDTPAEAELAQVLAKLPLLEALHLQYNGTVVSDSVLNEIGEKCSRLRTLDLGRCAAITDRGLESLRNLKHLKSLNLGHTNITDDGIEKLFANNHCWKQSLCELKLDNCVNITDYGIEVVLETCQEKLNIFIIHACPRTTDRSVMAIESFLNSRGQKVEQVTWTFY